MKNSDKRTWLLAISLVGATWPAAAMQISGLSAMEPLVLEAVQPFVQGGRLHIAEGRGDRIEIAPWPDYLPQQFGSQAVTAARSLHPAGPSDRVTFRAAGAHMPWLVIATGLRSGHPVLGQWQLSHESDRWVLRSGQAWRGLRRGGKEAEIGAQGERWCIYLLDTRTVSTPMAGIAREEESQADLAIVQAGRGNCMPAMK